MGGPYNIPRSYQGENRILLIFTTKSFVYTAVGGGIGFLLLKLLDLFKIKLKWLGIAAVILFALIGYIIGTFKVPELNKFEFTKKVGGENLDEIIKRWIKFKKNKKKIYIYKEKGDT